MPTMTAALHDGEGRMRIANVQVPEAGPGDAVGDLWAYLAGLRVARNGKRGS